MPKKNPKLYLSESADSAKMKGLYIGDIENTIRDSSWHADSLRKPYNPDPLYQKAGDYSIYEEMLLDDQVSVCLQIKKDIVLNSGWKVISNDEKNLDIADEIESMLREDLDCPIEDYLEEILSAYEFGFSLSEKIFRKLPDGKITLKALKTRHPNTWLIHTDKHGNIERYQQFGLQGSEDIAPESLIHYINNRKFQNPYGTSDLLTAYTAWFAKKQVVKYFSIFMEKYASPSPIARYPLNAPKDAVTDLFNAIKKFQTKTALTIPKEVEIDFLESKNNGDVYQKALNIFNMFIGRSLMVPDLLGYQGSETSGGSYTLGVEQFTVLHKHLMRRRQTIEAVVNDHIIRPIATYNYGMMDDYPRFVLNPINEDDQTELVKLWLDAVKSRTFKPTQEDVDHFKEIVKFPKSGNELYEEEENNDMPENQEGAEEEMKEMESEEPEEENDAQTFSKKYDLPIDNYARLPEGYDRLTNYTKIKNDMDKGVETIIEQLNPVVETMIRDLKDQIEKKKILAGNIDRISTIKLKGLKDFKQILKDNLREGFRLGKVEAFNELFKSQFAKEPLPGDLFLKLLEEETFEYVGDIQQKLLKDIRVEAVSAIKDGQELSEFFDKIDKDIKKSIDISIERYARTKFTEVMNKGRYEFFVDSGVVKGFQYSAILDDRTTDICMGLHGKKFKEKDAPIPPMHFNALCEGSLIKLENGEKPIEQIAVGDKVVTHTGSIYPVYDVMDKFEDKEYYEIEFESGKLIKITGEHPVLTERGWIRADELLINDDIFGLEDVYDK